MRRGKYVLESRLAFPTKLCDDVESAVAKYVHGTRPEKKNTGPGTFAFFAKLPKKKVRTTIMSSGCSSTHRAPTLSACNG